MTVITAARKSNNNATLPLRMRLLRFFSILYKPHISAVFSYDSPTPQG